MSEPELTIPASPRVNWRLIVALCVGSILLTLVFVERDAVWLFMLTIAGAGAWWFAFVATTALFVDDERAGVRYLGGIRRSALRARITHVRLLPWGVAIFGRRRLALLYFNTPNWTNDEVKLFLRALDVPVFTDHRELREYARALRHDAP